MKYLSKLLSMLLVGVLLFAGCTDYDEDIKNLNNKIDKVQSSLMDDHISPLKSDLEKAKTDLAVLVETAKKELVATHKADVDALKAKDTELNGLITAANTAIAAANQRISDLEGQLDIAINTLKNDMATGDAATLKAAQEDAASKVAALKKELEGTINTLTNNMTEQVKLVNEAIAALNGDVDALQLQDEAFKTQLATIASDLATLEESLNNKYNELKGLIDVLEQKLQRQIDQNKNDIASLRSDLNLVASDLESTQTAVADLQKDMAANVEAFTKYQIAVDTKINDLTKRIEIAEQTLADIEENILPKMEQQIAANEELSKQNAADIAANEALFAAYKAEVNNTLAQLMAADEANAKLINVLFAGLEAVESNLANLSQDFEDYKSFIEGQLSDCWAGINNVKAMANANANTISQVKAALDAHLAALAAQMNAINANVVALEQTLKAEDAKLWNTMNQRFSLVEASIESNYTELSEQIAAVAKELEAYKAEVTKEISEAVEAAKNEFRAADQILLQTINVNTEKLQKQINELNTKIDNVAADLAAYKTEVNEKLAKIENDIDEIAEQLASMIQNITFVPEFADGKATAVRILGPKKGNSLTATTLTAQFDIVPAEAVNGLVNYLSENSSVRVYAKVQPVKPSRVEPIYAEGAQIVIAPDATVAGRVTVTAFVKNMPEDYANYAFALGVETQKTQAMSDFVFIHENSDAQYQYTFVNAENKTIEESHPNYDADQNAIVFSKKWTKATESLVNVVEGYTFKLTDGKKFYTTAEIAARHNMAEGALDLNMDVEVADVDKCVAVEGTSVKMASESEYDMFNHIGHAATLKLSAKSAIATDWSYAVNAIYNIVGPRVEKNVYYITEPGDLYWLSVAADLNNVSYDKVTVIFDVLPELKDLLLMNGYISNKPAGEFLPINFNGGEKLLTVVGNNAIVNGLKIKGEENVGLFGYVVGNIEGLHVMNATIEGTVRVGGLVGHICGNVDNCSVDNSVVTATPVYTGTKWDDGNSVGGIVGYLEADTENGPYYNVKNCVVSGVKINGFRDAGSVVGTAYVGTDNVRDNLTNNVQILVNQRPALYPGYIKPANIGHIIGRVLPAAKAPYAWAENKNVFNFDNSSLRIQYALGAEVDATSVDAADHTLEIFTANGLAWFSNNVVVKDYYTYSNVIFTDNIDFGGKTYFKDDNCTFKAINNWEGKLYRSLNFDGQNKVVSNLTINDPSAKDLGLFGSYVGDVKNVTMNNVALIGLGRIAPVATQLWGNIDNCHVDGFVGYAISNGDDGDKVGGLVAQMQDPNAITNCSVKNADIEGYRDLGAVAGMANLNKYENVVVENVNIWINQVVNAYGSYVPFATESALVGRQTGAVKPALEAEGVNVYNILNAELGRRYVADRKGDLYLGYDVTTSTVADQLVANAAGRSLKFDAKQNSAALFQFAAEYKSYKAKTVNQVTDMELTKSWTAIGGSWNERFEGTYNGNNKTISKLNVVEYSTTPSGLFGWVLGTLKNIKVTDANISGCHYAGAVASVLFGTVEGCEVSNTTIVLLPEFVTGVFDNGDKAGALVGYLADNGIGADKVINNKVSGVNVKGYREVAGLVGRANTIDEMSGNVVENCEIVLDQMIAGSYVDTKDYFSTIGTLIGRLDDNTIANITNNTVTNVNLNTVDAKGVEAKIENPKEVGLNE